MDSAGVLPGNTANNCGNYEFCRVSGNVRGVCPEGWHLPDSEEFAVLLAAVENPNNLKSSVGWNDSTLNLRSDNGTDDYGFSAIPISCGDFPIEGREACFCSSSTLPNTSSLALYMSLRYDKFSLVSSMGRRNMCSVRCIKD